MRDASKIPEDLRSVQCVVGSATDEKDVGACIEGADVVIVSLGGPARGPGVDVCSTAQALINTRLAAMDPQPLCVVVSSIGVGDHYQHCSLFAKAFASFVIPEALEDKDKQERSARDQLEKWIVLRPGGLVDGPVAHSWKVGEDVCGFYPKISRETLAEFIVAECIQPDSHWLRRSVAVVS